MKVVVCGFGSIGRRHARNLTSMGQQVGVIDPDVSTAQSACEEAGYEFVGPDVTSIKGSNADACVIASPHRFHLEQAQAALDAGAHVLIEKPLGLDLSAAGQFAKRHQRADRVIAIACNMRFHPGIRALSDNLHRLGRIYFAQAHFGSYLPDMRPGVDHRTTYAALTNEGGAILDGVHELDIVTHLLGPVAAANGFGAQTDPDLQIEVEDFGQICSRHQSGAMSSVTLDYLRRFKSRGCKLVGERGELEWVGLGKTPETLNVTYRANDGTLSTIASDGDVDKNAPYVAMMQNFVDAIGGKPNNLQTVDEAVRILDISLKARESRLDQ